MAGAVAQAPLGLTAGYETVCIARRLEGTGSGLVTPFGGWFSHPTQQAAGARLWRLWRALLAAFGARLVLDRVNAREHTLQGTEFACFCWPVCSSRVLRNSPFLCFQGRLVAMMEAEFDVEEAVILQFC